jgi:hypothetical protein
MIGPQLAMVGISRDRCPFSTDLYHVAGLQDDLGISEKARRMATAYLASTG